jgi:hypothetical protein
MGLSHTNGGDKPLDREKITSKFMDWSKDFGLAVTILQDPNVDFHIVISEPNLPPIDIVHPTIDSKFVFFATRVNVAAEDQKKLLDLIPEEREGLLWDIRFKLLSMNLEFRMQRPESVTLWEIMYKVFLEGLTVQSFFDNYLKLKNGAISIIWSYRRTLDRKSAPYF